MSALWAPVTGWKESTRQPTPTSARLSAVPARRARMARMPFLIILVAVFGMGMAGLLLLNTTLQNQAFQSRGLNRQATELAYAQGELESRIDQRGAPQELARRASSLGMRANPEPAFLVAPTGKVLGDAKPVTGSEVPSLIVKSPQEIAADKAAARARAELKAAQKAAAAKAKAEAAKRKAEQQAVEAKNKAEQKKLQAKTQQKKSNSGNPEGRG